MPEEHHPLYQRFLDTPTEECHYFEINKGVHEKLRELTSRFNVFYNSWQIRGSELLIVLYSHELEKAREALQSGAIPAKIGECSVTVAPWSHYPL